MLSHSPDMQPDDAIMDYEEFERDRSRVQAVLASLEGQRASLEAEGHDVNATIAGIMSLWQQYETAQQRADAALEGYLQAIANQVDAGEELLARVREGLTRWEKTLAASMGSDSLQRAYVWQQFQSWKARVRSVVQEPSPHASMPEYQRIVIEVLCLLD